MQVCARQPFIAVGPVCYLFFASIHMKDMGQEGDKSTSHSLTVSPLMFSFPRASFCPNSTAASAGIASLPLQPNNPMHTPLSLSFSCRCSSDKFNHLWKATKQNKLKALVSPESTRVTLSWMPPLEGAVGVQKCEFIQLESPGYVRATLPSDHTMSVSNWSWGQ